MSATLNLGTDGNWATKKDTILAYNDENSNFKPLPFSFDRASSATRVNKDGLIETVGSGEPRIDYKDDSKGALKLEPSRSNSITYSEDFQSSWSFINVDKTLSQVKNPSGNLGVYEIASNSSGMHYFEPTTYNATSGVDYTFSFFAKKNGSNFVQVALSTGFSPLYQNFNLLDGTLGNGNLTSGYYSNIEPFGNGWYRVSITATTLSANARFLTIPILTDIALRNPSFSGDGTLGVYVWGFQKEQGSYPTSYIPTQGSVVTRVADACDNGGNEQVFNNTEGVLYVEIASFSLQDNTERKINLSNNGNSFLRIQYGGTPNLIYCFVYINGVKVADIRKVLDTTNFNKVALRYSSLGYTVYINGIFVETDSFAGNFTSYPLVDLSYSEFKGKTKDIRYYNTALSDSELAALTQV